MAERLLAIKRTMKPNASIYLHCDGYASHYLKAAMDAVFGKDNFKNEIVWCYTGPSNTKRWFPPQARCHLVLFKRRVLEVFQRRGQSSL